MQDDYGITEETESATKSAIKSPMPSTVSKIFVKVGDTVKKGDNLVSLEAMKMEHLIKSGREGKIKAVHIKESKFVDAHSILVEFED